MTKPLLTVLMPVFNAEKYLPQAIDSILHQTLTDFEFLIIDDGSADSSVEIIRAYTDPRIRLVRNEQNLGISATLNKGIALASAELIARMDADDISYPTRLQKQYEYFQAHPDCALVSTWAREITEDNKPILTEEFNSDYYRYMLNFECWIYHPTVMYKKAAVLEFGGYSERYCEDYDLWWKLSRKYPIVNLPEVLLDYRSTNDSLCRVTKQDEYEEGHRKQLLRNVRYYAGESFELTNEEIECLRYNCEPLLKLADLSTIVRLFEKLAYINRGIFKKEAKEEISVTRKAAAYKKQSLLSWFIQRLPYHQKLQLLLRTRNWKMLGGYSINKLSALSINRKRNYLPA